MQMLVVTCLAALLVAASVIALVNPAIDDTPNRRIASNPANRP